MRLATGINLKGGQRRNKSDKTIKTSGTLGINENTRFSVRACTVVIQCALEPDGSTHGTGKRRNAVCASIIIFNRDGISECLSGGRIHGSTANTCRPSTIRKKAKQLLVVVTNSTLEPSEARATHTKCFLSIRCTTDSASEGNVNTRQGGRITSGVDYRRSVVGLVTIRCCKCC